MTGSIRNLFFILSVVLTVGPGIVPEAHGVITSNPLLPPDTGAYLSKQQITTYTAPGLDIIATEHLFDPLAATAVRTQVGADELETFDSIFTADFNIFLAGSTSVSSIGELTGPASILTHQKWDTTTGSFDSEILSMELAGQVEGISLLIRESPSLLSLGQTLISDIGGGLYSIESFFDVFTELSVDGGATWIPANDSIRMVLVIPEPATIAILALGALMMSRKH
ncbi:MAG TPA: PEP-CTERM sorting domain-containing protein [Planctomycetes bacterium]|nr:PEP-CTERM sorting domain-containing protein [Planctomycetota bacterium]